MYQENKMSMASWRRATAVLVIGALYGCGAEPADQASVAPNDAVAVDTLPPAQTSPPAADTAAPVATQPAVLTVGRAGELGPYISDAGGRALYMFTADRAGQSNCYDACAGMWPPFVSPAGTPRPGAAEVEPALIGTVERRDKSLQVTYGGHPLYYYHKDQGPGQAKGQDVHDSGGEWYLLTSQGKKLEQH